MPARLSHQLKWLPRLLGPLVLALRSRPAPQNAPGSGAGPIERDGRAAAAPSVHPAGVPQSTGSSRRHAAAPAGAAIGSSSAA